MQVVDVYQPFCFLPVSESNLRNPTNKDWNVTIQSFIHHENQTLNLQITNYSLSKVISTKLWGESKMLNWRLATQCLQINVQHWGPKLSWTQQIWIDKARHKNGYHVMFEKLRAFQCHHRNPQDHPLFLDTQNQQALCAQGSKSAGDPLVQGTHQMPWCPGLGWWWLHVDGAEEAHIRQVPPVAAVLPSALLLQWDLEHLQQGFLAFWNRGKATGGLQYKSSALSYREHL